MAGLFNNCLHALFPNVFKKNRVHSSIATDSKRILKEDTPFAITEAYRALYTNILYLPIESKCKKIAVFSAVPGEGKTTVSINLAYTIAANSTESKVLIIDADMRKPRVASLLGLSGKKMSGLSEYLAGIDDTPALVSTKYDNLYFLPSGAVNANSPALLSTAKMKKLLEILEEGLPDLGEDSCSGLSLHGNHLTLGLVHILQLAVPGYHRVAVDILVNTEREHKLYPAVKYVEPELP